MTPATTTYVGTRTTNLHEAAELITPAHELFNILRREELPIDTPWKQGLIAVLDLVFDKRMPAALGLSGPDEAFQRAGAIVRNQLLPLLDQAGASRRNALTMLAVLSFEPQTVQLLSTDAGAAPLLLRELLRGYDRGSIDADPDAVPDEEQQLAAYALMGLSAEPLGRAALLLEEPVGQLCELLRRLLRGRAMPASLCFCLIATLANLALHDVAAREMLADGAAQMLVGATTSRVVILYPPSLLSALQAHPAQRTRANLGGVAARALINMASSAPGGREAVRKAGGAERLWMLGWGTTDEGVQGVVREGIALIEGVDAHAADAGTRQQQQKAAAAAAAARSPHRGGRSPGRSPGAGKAKGRA